MIAQSKPESIGTETNLALFWYYSFPTKWWFRILHISILHCNEI